MIYIYGDSNFRNCLEINGERLAASVGDQVIFKMATSNESIRTQLESLEPEAQPKVVMVGLPLNEVIKTCSNNKNKGRDETLRTVVEDLGKTVHQSAEKHQNTLHIMIPSFLRLDPPWWSSRVKLGIFYIKEAVTINSPWNIAIANPVDVCSEDLGDDGIHLNSKGKEKLYKSLESDLLKCLENLGEGRSQDWASQMSTSYEPPTPSTLRKRARPDCEDEEDSDVEDQSQTSCNNKKAKLDTVLDRINLLVKEIQTDRASSKIEINNLGTKIEENKIAIDEIKITVKDLEKKNNDGLTAEMREDIDGLENENLKSIVIVRKLATKDTVPKDKKALRNFIQSKARELVMKVVNKEASINVKFAVPLYSFVDPSKKDNQAGLIPPFKIGFGSKDIAIKFRDQAVKLAKEIGSEYKNTYFSFFQSAGTRIRLIIMWSIADNLKNDLRQVWVTQNSSKPVLQIKEGGKIVKTLTYVKAVSEYKDKIAQKALDEAKKLAQKSFEGNLEKTFLVIKD
jgi:hypothetical protein